jgi:aspartyl aminopeptidase
VQKVVKKNINEFIANKLGIAENSILSYDISLYDICKAEGIGEKKEEFISSARLDNLAMTHAAMKSFLNKEKNNSTKINIFLAFDHEEVGSQSFKGAKSNLIKDLLEEILSIHLKGKPYIDYVDNSLIISADMAHALHPNYTEMHDELNFPLLNMGPVVKYNSNQRYSSNAESVAFIVNLARTNNIPLQNFMNRQDLSCGSTIGPSISSMLGINSIDIGNPMLSMHSIRELAGLKDHGWIIDLFDLFYSF